MKFAVVPLALLAASALGAELPQHIEFNRDVRPILSENCFKCHGFDKNKREADRRLDTREGALAENDGVRGIVPSRLDESEVHLRIHSRDKDEQMPPPKSGKKLTARQIAILDRWIEQGAEYQPHWAYLPPQRPVSPAEAEGKNPIDTLIAARHAQLGLVFAPEADPVTLIRRLSFDLNGLPPTPTEVDAFGADLIQNPKSAIQNLVARLLDSPAFGERMAVQWLDVVRYADTVGFHSDNPRNVWPYRDYVIRAFNENKPFDQFTIEQLAGDLLPGATEPQRIASAFNRLNLTTEEGGAQGKDYEARSVADRVRAIGTVWLAQTTGCAQCHDHKYDPITARDFYRLGAFFADLKESAIGRREDGMLLAAPEQEGKLKAFDERIAEIKLALETATPELAAAQAQWEASIAPSAEELPNTISDALKTPAEERNEGQRKDLAKFYRTIAPLLKDTRAEVTAAEKQRKVFYDALPKCLVSEAQPKPRTVRVLPRGNWQDESGEIVSPGVPQFLPQPAVEGRPLTRLDLAQWLVARENPLTARVFVNRLWKLFFGTGLSKVLDDLGAQGEPPANAALLDWLACEFMDSGWDVKHLTRLIVTSRTYRQRSQAAPELLQRDPENRELARQSRFRLDAEFVRDNALAISGLLVRQVGGTSVHPYQPAGYWENLNFPTREWQPDKDSNQWRRGLYTWWQRSYLHPSLLAFDAPSREECVAERVRSNIPQQALVLLNDPTYVEAARVFAGRILRETSGDTTQRLTWAFRQALGRPPRADELTATLALFGKHLAAYTNDAASAAQLVKTGLAPVPADVNPSELAAWTSVARVLLNLHETITRS